MLDTVLHSLTMRKLRDFEPYLTSLLSLLAPQTTFSSEPSLQKIMNENKRLGVVLNHAAPLSWVPAPSLLTKEVCNIGGGDRLPRGIIDQCFFQFAPFKPVAKYVTQSEDF